MGKKLTSTRNTSHERSLDRRNVKGRYVQSPMSIRFGDTANLGPSGGKLDGDVESVSGVEVDTLDRGCQVRLSRDD